MSGNNRIYLKGLTQALTECASEGTTYAKCVAVKESVKLNDCSSEFNALRNCVVRTVFLFTVYSTQPDQSNEMRKKAR